MKPLNARCLLGVLALAGLQALAAPPSGSPTSATCRQALDTLREREDRVLAATPRGAAEGERRQMLQARRVAALACLGEAEPEVPRRLPGAVDAQLPIAPMKLAAPRPAGPAAPPAAPPPALPRTLTTCDANGCWTSDGQRLQRVGPQLLGPRGFCSVTGAAVQCP